MKIQFSTSGAAFKDEYTGEDSRYDEALEVNRILKEIIHKIEYGQRYGVVMDVNGNKIGSWEM